MNPIQYALNPVAGPGPSRNRHRNPLWRLRRLFFIGALFAVAGVGVVLNTFSNTELPEDRFSELAQTSFICTAEVTSDCGPDNATAVLATGGEDREVVSFNEIPPHLVAAVVATEDQSFFTHRGIDPRGISRAAYRYAKGDRIVQGGSTITQQYVKLAFNDRERDLSRKAREAIRAIKLEQDLAAQCSENEEVLGDRLPGTCAKEEILTRYLNRAYFGRGASGVQSAAQVYFGKDVSGLTLAESAFMAGLLRNPEAADPSEDLVEANRRRKESLEGMIEIGAITQTEAVAANTSQWDNLIPDRSREGLGDVKGADFGSEYFVEEVRQELVQLFPNGGIYTSGLRVYTTLNQDLQAAAFNAAHAPKPNEDLEARGHPQLGPTFLNPADPADPSAALVSLDSRGHVVAMLAGSNYDESEFNLATSSGNNGRQPGSTFKPIGLAAAIEQNFSARSLYPAAPGSIELGGACENEVGEPWIVSGGSSSSKRYRDLIEATKWSSNIVYAQLVVDITPNALNDAAQKYGVRHDLGQVNQEGVRSTPCSLILGTQGVPVIDMASVYSTFERAGGRLDPVLIERIENADGEIICWYPTNGACAPSNERQPQQVLAADVARQVNFALTEVVNGGTGAAAQFSDRPVAGKTGTSQAHRDGWFAGFTCDLTTVVWIGHESERPMIDFRRPKEDGSLGYDVDEEDQPIDDRAWPNLQGGNMPTYIWANYMAAATANMPPCEGLEVSSEFTGEVQNPELSVSTRPPCGVELDDNGFPRGGADPANFIIKSVVAYPTFEPIDPNLDPGQQRAEQQRRNEAIQAYQQQYGQPQQGCVPIEVWAQQREPGFVVPTNPNPAGPQVDVNGNPIPDGGNGGRGNGNGGNGGNPNQPQPQPQPQPSEPTDPQGTQPPPEQTQPTPVEQTQPTLPPQPTSPRQSRPSPQPSGQP